MQAAVAHLADLLAGNDPNNTDSLKETAKLLDELTRTLDRSSIQEDRILEQFESMKKAYSALSYNMKCLDATYTDKNNPRIERIRAALAPIMDLAAQEYECSRFTLYRVLSTMSSAQFGEVVFAGAITLPDVNRRFRRASLYFGNESFRDNKERVEMRKIMLMLTTAVEEKRSSVFDEDTLAMVAEEHFKNHYDSRAILAYLEGRAEADILIDRGLDPDEYTVFDKLPSIEAARMHALAAAKIFHVLVEKADQDSDTVEGAENQIKYRRNIAECFFHVGYDADAQLYLIGAIHIAHEQGKQEAKQELQCFLREIKDRLAPLADAQPPRAALFVRRRASNAEAPEHTPTNDPRLWLALHTVRSESGIVQYCTSQEEIVAAQQVAEWTRVKGISLITAVIVVPTVAVGAAAVLAPVACAALLVASPLGLVGLGVVAIVSIATSVYVGTDLIRVGKEMMSEPNLRMKLNNIIAKAMRFFQQGQFTEFVKLLASDYGVSGAPKHLFVYDAKERLTIDSEAIIAALLGHGFRPDGIAYILNVLAEALTSSKIEFDPTNSQNTGTHLRAQAINIFHVIIHSQLLRDEADRLDQRILDNTLVDRARQFEAYWNEFKDLCNGNIIGGIPESFYHDEEAAPFFARLEEMRNNARMNYAILDVIEGEVVNLNNAARLLLQVRKSPYNQFRYFTVSDHRIHTIQDLTSAFDIVVDEENAEFSNYEMLTNLENVATILLGSNKVTITERLAVVKDESIFDFFRHFGLSVSRENAITRLRDYIEMDTRQREEHHTDPFTGVSILTYAPIGRTASYAVYMQHVLSGHASRPGKALSVATLLHTSRYPVLEIMFAVRIVRCKIGKADNDEDAFICLDDIRVVHNLHRTVFVYAPEYYAQPDYVAHITPTFAVTSNSNDFVPVQRGDASAFLHAGMNYFSDYHTFRSEREKRNALFAAHEQFVLAVHTVSFLFFKLSSTVSDEIVDAFLMLAECKIELQKLTAARDMLQHYCKHEKFKDLWRYWYLLAKTRRKLFDYRAASVYIHRASRILNDQNIDSPSFHEYAVMVKRELALLEKLRPLRMTDESLHVHCRKYFMYALPKQDSLEERSFYNVLCIDGGGIKGIIACLILAEIERRSGKAIRHLFQHIAGTSTGAIIAGALALPHATEPNSAKFTAYDVLEMYADPINAALIFKPTLHYFGLVGAKYDPNGRATLIKKYYGEATFKDATVQLTILAGNENRGNDTMEFSKQSHPDTKLIDAAMASSAAPTYFPAYKIENASYTDGGLTANNPSSFAFAAAQSLCNQKPIRMLSLGCGDVITEFVEHNQGAWFYAPEAPNQAICAQQLTADNAMAHSNIQEYQRWQPLFEKLTGMDDIKESTLRLYVETAKQYIYKNEKKIDQLIASLTEA